MDYAELASKIVIKSLIAALRFYQRFLSPFTGPSCRFYPSCSDYSIQALLKHGIFLGAIKTAVRLLKCHPFHPGGYDPVT